MFNRENHTNEYDPLKAQFQGMNQRLRASAELKQALKTGTPLHTPIVGKRVHVRRFSRAIAAYAVCALILLGAAIVLPSLLKGNGPTPASSSTNDPARPMPQVMLSPTELYEQLLNAPNLTYRGVGTVYYKDGSEKMSDVTEMTRQGDLFTTLNYGNGEPQNVHYYDVGADKPCVYYPRSGLWFTRELQGVNATWEHWCKAYLGVDWLKDEHFDKIDDGYMFTEEYIAKQKTDHKCEDAEGTLTVEDGVYTLRVVWYTVQAGKEIADRVYEIQISFGNAPEIVLPEATICAHEYEVEVIPSDHPCRYGDETRYTCKICNDHYNEWSPTIPHNLVNGICTVCGFEEEFPPDVTCVHDQDPATCLYCNCDQHVWITSENTPTCTEGCTVVETCIKCGYSLEEWHDPVGHEFVNGVCTVCYRHEEEIGNLHHNNPHHHE